MLSSFLKEPQMMFSKISRMVKLLAILMIFFAQSVWSMVYNIKGTYDVVKDEYKHLSLLHGAILWETGFIRRLYDFGETPKEIFKDVKEKEATRKVIAGYQPGGHDMARLVRAFFYRVPGSTASTDFGETKQIEQKTTDESILIAIADLLACCVRIRKDLPLMLKSLGKDKIFALCSKLLNEKKEEKRTQLIIHAYEDTLEKENKILLENLRAEIKKKSLELKTAINKKKTELKKGDRKLSGEEMNKMMVELSEPFITAIKVHQQEIEKLKSH